MTSNVTVTIAHYLEQELAKCFFETTFDLLNEIEFDDLESLMNSEFLVGLPSDTEFGIL